MPRPSSLSTVHWLKWVVLVLALVQGAWLAFDGGHALVTGDYVTPKFGPRAGQLGPWAGVVSALGFEPRSTAVKCLHVLLGAAWLAAVALFLLKPALGWWVLLACAVASLCYAPIGTFLGLAQLALLLTPQIRQIQ